MNEIYDFYRNINDIVGFYKDKTKNISPNGKFKIVKHLGSGVFYTESYYSIGNTDYTEYILFIPKKVIHRIDEIKKHFKNIGEKIDLFEYNFVGQYIMKDPNYVIQIYRNQITWIG